MRRNSLNANSLQTELQSFQNPRPLAGGFVEVDAFAKINLFLAVMGKRSDGYHELVSVMQAVKLHDTLLIQKLYDAPSLITLSVDIPNLPTDDTNLVVKAAKLLMQEYGITQPIQITLTKRIPMGAGLGGGSSDCAATLHGLNQLFDLKIPMDKLMEMGKALGADVPFCLFANIQGSTAFAKGIGEKLVSLSPHPHCYIVLACPPIHVSTKEIFGKLRLEATNYNLDKFMLAYEAQDIAKIAQNFENTFTPITSAIHPQISALIADLQNHGALGAAMTGTGSAVFAYFDDEDIAQSACDILQAAYTNTKFFVTLPK